MDMDYILYSLCVEDAQNVAGDVLGRLLTDEELKRLREEIGDYFLNWYDLMELAIHDVVKKSQGSAI